MFSRYQSAVSARVISKLQSKPIIMSSANPSSNTAHNPWLAGIGYMVAAASIFVGWLIHDLRLVVASEGLGYMLGIIGTSMMVLLLLYPLRKRARLLRNAGPIRHWFRIHMMLGVVGPVLVLFHSNFSLGSINSQVALFCTIVVASSGVVGRYLYAKIHNGMYGKRLSITAIQSEMNDIRGETAGLGSIMSLINQHLTPIEAAIQTRPTNLGASVVSAFTLSIKLSVLKQRLRKLLRQEIGQLAAGSEVIRSNEKRLLLNTMGYLNQRLSVLRKFAQLHACERLFSLWHVVHYPLFMVLVVAAIVHVIAVHMY